MSVRVLLKPRWLIGHVVIVVVAAVMLSLAGWQNDRLEQRRKTNVVLRQQLLASPVEVRSADNLEGLSEQTKIRVVGSYDDSQSVYVRYKLFDGTPGVWVLTPFRLVDGSHVIVNRGWRSDAVSKSDSRTSELSDLSPGSNGSGSSGEGMPGVGQAEVSLEGLVQKFEPANGTTETTDGEPPVPTVRSVNADQLTELIEQPFSEYAFIQRVDPEELAARVQGSVSTTSAVSADNKNAIAPLPAPELSEGSHFAYVLQWIAFTIVIVVGYVLLLRRAIAEAGS